MIKLNKFINNKDSIINLVYTIKFELIFINAVFNKINIL